MSVPVGLSSRGLPLGLQIIGRAFNETTIFRIAAALEQSREVAGLQLGYPPIALARAEEPPNFKSMPLRQTSPWA
jgi:hypothetical protein